MADINRVILVGRLTRDAELKYTAGGQAVCKFSVAVNRSVKKGDNWEEEPSFFDVTLWGRKGEAVNQYLLKGTTIGVDGELRQDRWQQDGQNRSKVEIIATNIQLLGGNRGGGAGSASPSGQGSSQGSSGGTPSGGGQSGYGRRDMEPPPSDDGFTDDIPF